MPAQPVPLQIIADTREQNPLTFSSVKDPITVTRQALPTADYSMAGWENIVLCERKGALTELHTNLVGEDYRRFRAELQRLSGIPSAHVLLCFDFAELLAYPWQTPSIPFAVRRKIKATGPYLIKRLLEVQAEFPGIRWWFVGRSPKAAEAVIIAIFKQAIRDHQSDSV